MGDAKISYSSDLVRTKNWSSEILTDADLEGQFDLIIAWIMAAMNSTTGHDHSGSSNKGPKVSIASGLTITSQALGDTLYASSSTVWARIAGNITTTKKFYNQTGTGVVSAAPTWDALVAADIPAINVSSLPAGSILQIVNVETGAVATGTTAVPFDDTIPQNTEGDQYMTLSITPASALNKLKIDVIWNGDFSAAADFTVALFQDSIASALACTRATTSNSGYGMTIPLTHFMLAGTTSSITFKVRVGGTSGTATFNGSASSRKYGGVIASSITITEIKV